MIHIDKNGNVIGSFDAPQGHGMDVDSKGFVYLGQDTVRKYDSKTGMLVKAVVPVQPGGVTIVQGLLEPALCLRHVSTVGHITAGPPAARGR